MNSQELIEYSPYIYIGVQFIFMIAVSIFGLIYVQKQLPSLPSNTSNKSLIKLYFKTIWDIKGIYGSGLVHIFDVFSDLLIIVEWYSNNDDNSHLRIKSETFADISIIVLIFHKIIGVLAFWSKERNIYRCILQLFDVLIFQEIYICHAKLLKKYHNVKLQGQVNHTKLKVQSFLTC